MNAFLNNSLIEANRMGLTKVKSFLLALTTHKKILRWTREGLAAFGAERRQIFLYLFPARFAQTRCISKVQLYLTDLADEGVYQI